MLSWSNLNVMNKFVENVYINEAETNRPKENVPPPLPVPYPEIYHILVDNVYIHEDDTNRTRENLPSPILVTHQKIYHILVTKIINYVNNSYLIIGFVDVFHE